MMDIQKIPTSELVHYYLESYMDMARCELALLYPDNVINNHETITDRMHCNIVTTVKIVHELSNRKDTSLFDRREFILGVFST